MEHTSPPAPMSSHLSAQEQCTARLQQDRESEGRCGLCGVQTHRLCYRDAGAGTVLCKEPLDVEGEVHRGRCLLCHPLPDDFTVHSGGAACSFPLFVDSSPDHVFHFPTMMSQQTMMFPPLPLQPAGRMALHPPPSTIRSIPNLDMLSILTLMRMHPSSLPLISSSLRALRILSAQERNAISLCRIGAVPTLLETISLNYAHHDISSIQNATILLHNLSMVPSNRPFLLEHNTAVVPTLVSMLNTYTRDAIIQRHGILTLGCIAKHSIDAKIYICERGGMMAIMKAVEVFGVREGVESSGEDVCTGVLRAAYWSLRRLGMPRLNGLVVGGSEESDGDE